MKKIILISVLTFIGFAAAQSSNTSGANCYDAYPSGASTYESEGTINFIITQRDYTIVQLKSVRCTWVNLWFENSTGQTNNTNSILSTLLTAKSTGAKVKIHYWASSTGQISFNGTPNYGTNQIKAVALK